MKRLIAFMTMLVTIILLVLITILPYTGTFGADNFWTDFTFGFDYQGGYEGLYKIERTDGVSETFSRSKMDNIVQNFQDKVEAVGVKNAKFNLENDSNIRVSLPVASVNVANAITTLIEGKNDISVRQEDGTLIATGNELFEENAFAEVKKDGAKSYITFNFTPEGKTALLNLVREEVPMAVDAEGNQNGTQNVVFWLGFLDITETEKDELGLVSHDEFGEFKQIDDLVNQYQTTNILTLEQRIVYNRYKTKIVGFSTFALSESTDEPSTPINAEFKDTQLTFNNVSYNSEIASAMVRSINKGEITDYTVNRISLAKVNPSLGSSALSLTSIAFLVGLLLVAIFLVVLYKLPGVAASFALIAHTLICFVLFKAFSGEFGPIVFVGLIISIAVALDAIIVMFERIKDEMRKGKSIEKSFTEASKKINSTVLDTNIAILLISLIMFFFGKNQIRTLATILSISSASIIVVVILLVKLLSNCLYKSPLLKDRYDLFLWKKKENSEEKESAISKINFFGKTKQLLSGVGGVIVISLIVGFISLGVGSGFLNAGSDFASITKITVQTNLDKKVIANVNDENNGYLKLIGTDFETYISEKYDIKADNSFVTDNTLTYRTVLVTSEKEAQVLYRNYVIEVSSIVEEATLESIRTDLEKYVSLVNDLNENNTETKLPQYLFTYSVDLSTNVTYINIVWNALLVVGLALVVVALYLLIRFKYTYSLAALVGIISDLVLTFIVIILFRVSIDVVTITALVSIVVLSTNSKLIVFDRIRENMNGQKKKVFTHDERTFQVNRALQQSFFRTLISGAALVITLIVIGAIGQISILDIAIILILGLIISTFTTFTFVSQLWIFFDDKLTLKKQNPKKRVKAKQPNDELTEQIFIGIND